MAKLTKAELWLQQLDNDRCDDNWDAVPEAVRKLRKHAGDRECLATTAETEYAITKAQLKQTDRPSTALSTKDLDTAVLMPKLLSAVDSQTNMTEDKFQALVCIGWLHWSVGEYGLAAARLPESHEQDDARISEWTRVCALKSAYLKANCLSRTNERIPALGVFESALSSLSSVWTGQRGRKQLQFWAELFLTEYCMLQAQAMESGDKTLADTNSLAAFRSWARYWETSTAQGTSLAGGHGFRGAVPRRRIWNEYYSALSAILEQDLPYPSGQATAAANTSARGQLRMELKRVEAVYESLLLAETAFPRADEEREEIEIFVDMVMRNWNILSSPNWQDSDLGQDGKEGLGRGVLEILYRAATKTFHSTAILRHLFTVHLAVAEFDLAFKAFNSYLDIVKKGKARVDKTGHPEPSLDDDTTVLETVSTAITALCRYGFRDEAERAFSLGAELEEMLQKLPEPIPNTDQGIASLSGENGNGVVIHPRISAKVNGLAWQAIGLSQAQWSRMTFDAAARTEIQEKAVRTFQKSLSPDTGNPTDIRTLFTLGLLLAEQRELPAAIDIVKAALMSNKKHKAADGSYRRERSLIPLWHLLALLLSARQDYVMAARACEGAFEQFDDPNVLFGTQGIQRAYRSDHLNEAEAGNESAGLVDEMDDSEKESIIEVKMTQLALVELLEGPEVAVNASHELLVLYTRLFGSLQPNKPPTAEEKAALAVPASSAGTLKSIKGSIFRRRDRSISTLRRKDTFESDKSAAPTVRPQTAQTTAPALNSAPTIQVTKENHDNTGTRSRKSSVVSARGRRRSESMKRGNSLKKREGGPRRNSSSVPAGPNHQPTISDGDAYFTPGDSAANSRPDFFAVSSKNALSSQPASPLNKTLSRFDSTASSLRASMAGSDILTLESVPAPDLLPAIQFSKEQVKRQRDSILIKVWLMIAGFYRRAEMFKDSQGAIEEAKKLLTAMAVEIVKDPSSSSLMNHPGWGGKKCVEELWGDIHSETGHLSLAVDGPYKARTEFEEALMHYPNHPSAIVGLSNILLDIYSEVLLPAPAIPSITDDATSDLKGPLVLSPKLKSDVPALPSTPLGLGGGGKGLASALSSPKQPSFPAKPSCPATVEELPAPYKAKSLPLGDRLAARDRAYGLLSSLTKLGSGWNSAEAWFALARAHEESGQANKAKDALWWCVELEEHAGIRDWSCVGVGGYVL